MKRARYKIFVKTLTGVVSEGGVVLGTFIPTLHNRNTNPVILWVLGFGHYVMND